MKCTKSCQHNQRHSMGNLVTSILNYCKETSFENLMQHSNNRSDEIRR